MMKRETYNTFNKETGKVETNYPQTKREMKDVTGYISLDSKQRFWVDKVDVDRGYEIALPGDKISFLLGRTLYQGIVTPICKGRDDDVLLVEVVGP